MAFLATLIGYVGMVTAIAVALLMSLSAFLAPSQPKVPLQAVKMAPESITLKAMAISSTAKITTPKIVTPKITTPKIAPAARGTVQVPSRVSAQTVDAVPEDTIHKIRSIPEFRHDAYAHNAYAHNVQVADAPSQDQYPHRFVPRGHAKPRGHLIGLNFAARYMGYVDNPSGDKSRIR